LLLAIIQNPDEESEIKSAAIKRLGDIAKKIKSLSEENMPDSEKEIYIRQLLSQISGLMGNKKLAGHMRELFQAYQAIG